MPDPRFFEALGPVSLSRLAELTGSRLQGGSPDTPIAEAAPLNRAGADGVAFLTDRKRLADLKASQAAACFLPEALADEAPEGCAVLVTRHPQYAWALAAEALHRLIRQPASDTLIDPTAVIEEGAVVAPLAVVGPGARIGRDSWIGPGAVIGPGVQIGRDCRIGPHATVGCALIGDRVSLYAGAAIGEAGFGAAGGPTGVIDIPQLGRVILQDNVTIGANSHVDRGAYDDTVVGENTKIDNLVHIAHNTRVGRNCVMAAYVGISGSVTIGDGCAFGGRAGVADHVTIGDGASIGAAAGVMRNVPAGEVWSGYPAKPIREWLKETVWLAKAAHRKG
ncbi:UDP-3-O-(3-hydroxymyristoyl)glucosamine N-acyltransferase [Caulobacter sp. SLTY]|uniref:UDP-3-O-(3-hydroxymyristoyl)glucosamine N-acyltransferase n=1 Tax=Caulobacter sp. SLTY TaxID=2683262 RepID=UPI0014134374|nr:UDP-3-O-(3-hydroxymyristoyl)glucosamine N-acyltransferase [Caulobacter sp. SLTY]NBB17232.1 UDP-3-O-(3-hydroxymyristoyl)glucosamine N-acyltransferase [Caulobacter sp. SLTY]